MWFKHDFINESIPFGNNRIVLGSAKQVNLYETLIGYFNSRHVLQRKKKREDFCSILTSILCQRRTLL